MHQGSQADKVRTDHFVSSATGHQQSNSGGGSAGQGTYWEVRKAKMAEQAREGVSLPFPFPLLPRPSK
jgi:hypothetical protein